MASYVLRPWEGVTESNTNNLSSVSGNTWTFISASHQLAVGDTFRRKTGPAAGSYIVTNVAGAVVSAEPAAPGADTGGNCQRVNPRNAIKQGALPITSVSVHPTNQLTVATANFVAARVQRGDRAVITGSTGPHHNGTGNNGAFFVERVVSPTSLIVKAVGGLTGLNAPAALGSVEIRQGGHALDITINADPDTVSWESIVSNATTDNAGMTIAEAFDSQVSANGHRFVFLRGITIIRLLTTMSNPTYTWASISEIIVANNSHDGTKINASGFGSSTVGALVLGQAGASRYDARNGSAWIGFSLIHATNQGLSVKLYASYWDTVMTGISNITLAFDVLSSFLRGGYFLFNASTLPTNSARLESTTIVPYASGQAIVSPSTNEQDMAGILISEGIAGAITPGSNVTISGVRIGDEVGPFDIVLGQLDLKNHEGNRSLDQLFSIPIVINSRGTVWYTWNPRFVEQSVSVAIPVQGAWARVFEIDETTKVQTIVFTGMSGADGRLASGAGVDLRIRERLAISSPIVDTEYSHRFVVLARGFESFERTVKLRRRFDADFPLQRMAINYEGGA